MGPKSNSLFHFTKSIDTLKSILSLGVQPRYCLEDIHYFLDGDDQDRYLAFPISCFCDIPLSRLSEHIEFYGSYGIGFTQAWGLEKKLNPVVYCPRNSNIVQVAKYLGELAEGANEDNPKKEEKEEKDNFFRLISLMKALSGLAKTRGEDGKEKKVEKNFCQENEWRFVPAVNMVFTEKEFEKEKDHANKMLEQYALSYLSQDVLYIFVPEDKDIPGLIDFINQGLPNFSQDDLKILNTRIVSLNTLMRDM